MTPGFSTTSRTRPLLISKLDIYFREKACTVRSSRLIEELLVFVWNGNRPEAQRGYNDDLTIAFGIGLFVRDHALKLRNEGIELNKNALNHMGKSGFYSGAPSPGKSTWTQQIAGQEEDLDWLL
jgi:hypothetical protein